MQIFNRYILKNLVVTTVFVTLILSSVVVLTQSLRFLELIIEAGAGAGTFWLLTLLALPRFWEMIIPIAAMVATLFVYHRLRDHSELSVLRATGFSPLDIMRPAIVLSVILMTLLWGLTLWATPYSLGSLQKIRQAVKSQISASLLREGVFNRFGRDMTIYVQERYEDGSLGGLLIYDKSDRYEHPTTILARRGILAQQDGQYRVVVYDGTRQTFDPETSIMQRLDFERYTVDFPENDVVTARWREPSERTTRELFSLDKTHDLDVANRADFMIEFHRRLSLPILVFSFVMISASVLVFSRISRFSQNWGSVIVILGCVSLQGLFIAASNLAKGHMIFVLLMYGVPLIPLGAIFYLLSPQGEAARLALFYTRRRQRGGSS